MVNWTLLSMTVIRFMLLGPWDRLPAGGFIPSPLPEGGERAG
jgi:hypothetical protein